MIKTVLFSPTVPEMSEEQNESLKSTVKNIYDSLTEDLGENPDFKQYIASAIKNLSSEEKVKQMFPILKKGWELNGYKDSLEYSDIFSDVASNFRKLEEEFGELYPEEVKKENEGKKTRTNKKTSPTIGVNPDGTAKKDESHGKTNF